MVRILQREMESVGPIVWVRRRNGSWWPGKVLDPEEIGDRTFTSPKTGTPVKLLGKEDASVEWYNLQKSKRVKAFRCGEFDECIERAEAIQGMPPKKREKYATKEDAILHALELEKQLLTKEGNFDVSSDRRSSDGFSNYSENPGSAKRKQCVETVSADVEDKDETVSSPMVMSKYRVVSQTMCKDDRSPCLKRKLSVPLGPDDSDNSNKPVVGVKQIGAISTGKRSKSYARADSVESLHVKGLTPSQMRMPSSQFGGSTFCSHHFPLSDDYSSSGLMEDESNSFESDSSESETDTSKTEPDVDERLNLFPDATEQESTSGDDSDESELSGHLPYFYPGDPFFPYKAASEWKLKGRKNIRHLTKPPLGRAGEIGSSGPFFGKYLRLNESSIGYRKYGIEDVDLNREYFGTSLSGVFGMEYGGYPFTSKYASNKWNSTSSNFTDWEDITSSRRREHLKPSSADGRKRPMVVNIELKVQAGYKKEAVPIVCVTSKLNGRAIIGHGIQIEALEEGSSRTLIPTNDFLDHDGTALIPQAWRTARRSSCRVPRPNLSSLPSGDDVADLHLLSDDERRLPYRKSNGGRKPPRKSSKKGYLPSNPKTTTLSAIRIHKTESLHNCLVKPLTVGPKTTVACIPVKLVFSRLLEKINRPPSNLAAKPITPTRDI